MGNKELRDLTQSAIEKLKVFEKNETDKSPADDFIAPFLLACSSAQPRVIVLALDSLTKLMTYGHLCGDNKAKNFGLKGPSINSTIMETIVNAICACVDTERKTFTGDDSVQLQVIKALLTSVTLPNCQV